MAINRLWIVELTKVPWTGSTRTAALLILPVPLHMQPKVIRRMVSCAVEELTLYDSRQATTLRIPQLIVSFAVFSSPSKPSLRPNPFANLGTPSRARPPQSSFFTPQVPPKAAAPPFRNPAFTTPRRPFEDLALSEASGAEDSPAQTEVSDFPNDTPEVDHTSDINMGGMASPSKIDKSYRYNKAPFSSKKHTPGRGEIRTSRDLSVSEFIRKRKRHNLDRDVSNITRHRWTESDSDSGDSIAPRRRSRGKKKKKETPKGFLGSLFHILDEHPNAPDNLYRWVKLLVNFFLVSVFVYIGWSIVSTIKTDIENANEMARIEIMGRITECQTKYTINSCSNNDRPALQPSCDEWFECMTQNPEAIMRVKVTAKQIAEIINEFSDAMNLKAWVSYFQIMTNYPQLTMVRVSSSLYSYSVPSPTTSSWADMSTSLRCLSSPNLPLHHASHRWSRRVALDSCGFQYKHLE